MSNIANILEGIEEAYVMHDQIMEVYRSPCKDYTIICKASGSFVSAGIRSNWAKVETLKVFIIFKGKYNSESFAVRFADEVFQQGKKACSRLYSVSKYPSHGSDSEIFMSQSFRKYYLDKLGLSCYTQITMSSRHLQNIFTLQDKCKAVIVPYVRFIFNVTKLHTGG